MCSHIWFILRFTVFLLTQGTFQGTIFTQEGVTSGDIAVQHLGEKIFFQGISNSLKKKKTTNIIFSEYNSTFFAMILIIGYDLLKVMLARLWKVLYCYHEVFVIMSDTVLGLSGVVWWGQGQIPLTGCHPLTVILICCNPNYIKVITSEFCTCDDSCDVITCVKFWSDPTIG